MTLVSKPAAKKGKSKRGGGPVTEGGKKRVRMNALKHGLFSKELVVRDDEKPEYEELWTTLHKQYAPSTPMQQVGFARIVWSAWRFRQAIRLEMQRLNTQLQVSAQQVSLVEGTEEKAEAPRWYAFGRAELRAAERLLMDLRADIQKHGWHHAEQLAGAVKQNFRQRLL